MADSNSVRKLLHSNLNYVTKVIEKTQSHHNNYPKAFSCSLFETYVCIINYYSHNISIPINLKFIKIYQIIRESNHIVLESSGSGSIILIGST